MSGNSKKSKHFNILVWPGLTARAIGAPEIQRFIDDLIETMLKKRSFDRARKGPPVSGCFATISLCGKEQGCSMDETLRNVKSQFMVRGFTT